MATQQQIDQYTATIVTAAMAEGVPQTNAKLIASQGRLESSNSSGQPFSSNVFLTDNNSFGMKMPSVRKSPYIQRASTIVMKSEGSTPYAHYKNIADSAKDVVHWLKYNRIDWNKTNTPESYAAFLKSKGYYGNSQENYTAMLYSIYGRIKTTVYAQPDVSMAVVAGVVIVIGYGIFLIKNRKQLA